MADSPSGPELFHAPDSPGDVPHLLGSRCRICGYTCFPRRQVCIRCRREGCIEEIELGPYGTLETFAVMQVGRPDFAAPYAIGYVRTREGALVFTLLAGCPPPDDTSLAIGREMELVIEAVKQDEKGEDVVGWKFKPVEGRNNG